MPCGNGGTCIDKPNKYVCNCPEGFTGEQCLTGNDDLTELKNCDNFVTFWFVKF